MLPGMIPGSAPQDAPRGASRDAAWDAPSDAPRNAPQDVARDAPQLLPVQKSFSQCRITTSVQDNILSAQSSPAKTVAQSF